MSQANYDATAAGTATPAAPGEDIELYVASIAEAMTVDSIPPQRRLRFYRSRGTLPAPLPLPHSSVKEAVAFVPAPAQ